MMLASVNGRGHLAQEEDRERAVASQRIRDAGHAFAAQLFDAMLSQPAANREPHRAAGQTSRHRVDRPQ